MNTKNMTQKNMNRERSSTKLVKKILAMFHKQGILYTILRDYQFLFDRTSTVVKDLDVVVQQIDLSHIHALLKQGGFFRQPISPFSNHAGYSIYLPEEEKLLRFHFHIGGVSGGHVIYLPAKTLFARKKMVGSRKLGFWSVISDEDTLVTMLIHGGLDKQGLLREKIIDQLQILRKKARKHKLDLNYVETNLNMLLGKDLARQFLKFFFDGAFEDISNYAVKKRRAFLMAQPQRLLIALYVRMCSAIWHGLRRLRSAPLISFIGMDGTGKTTVTHYLISLLQKNNVRSAWIYTGRGRKNILPIQFFGKHYKHVEKKIDSRQQEQNLSDPFATVSWKRSLIYTFAAPVFACDLLLRYFIHIFPKRHADTVVITDRYSSDLLVMKHVPEWFRMFLYTFFPRPTQVIYLYNKPGVLYQRKPNHPRGDLERQQLIFHRILPIIHPYQIKSVTKKRTARAVAEISFKTILQYGETSSRILRRG